MTKIHRFQIMKFTVPIVCLFMLHSSESLFGFELSDWVEIRPFPAESSEMFCANHALDSEWAISQSNDELVVKHYAQAINDLLPFDLPLKIPFFGHRVVLNVSNGFLVGFDKGEWGGGLWWFSKNGEDNYRISDENIKSVVSVADSTLAIAGLAHLGINSGKVFELQHDEEKWTIARSLELGAAPCAVVKANNGAIIIVTTNGVSQYKQGTINNILSSDYSLLYPNSVVINKEGTIFIGMRYAVAKLGLTNGEYKESWLVKRGCESLKESNGKCVCVSKHP
jgi:hypothetical protein